MWIKYRIYVHLQMMFVFRMHQSPWIIIQDFLKCIVPIIQINNQILSMKHALKVLIEVHKQPRMFLFFEYFSYYIIIFIKTSFFSSMPRYLLGFWGFILFIIIIASIILPSVYLIRPKENQPLPAGKITFSATIQQWKKYQLDFQILF